MKLLYIIWNSEMGGAEGWILRNAGYLQEQGHNVCIWPIHGNGPLAKFAKEQGIDAIYPAKNMGQSLWKFSQTLATAIEAFQPEIIHTFGLKTDLLVRWHTHWNNKSYVLINSIRSTDPWRKWYHHFLENIGLKKVDLWIANSFAGKTAYLQNYPIRSDKIVVIHNDVKIPTKVNTIIDDTLNRPTRLLFVGNLDSRKGLSELIEALGLISGEGFSVELNIYGKDFSNNYFQQLVEKLGLTHSVIFHGYEADKQKIFSEQDIFISSSYWEGLSNSILEAMAYGMAVVATAVGGTPEIIEHQIDGILVPPQNASKLKDEIVALIQNRQKRIEMGANARVKVTQKFSVEAKREQLVNTYSQMLNPMSPRSEQ